MVGRKKYVLLCVFLLVLFMAACNKAVDDNTENSSEAEFIEYLLKEDSFKYSDSIMNEWNEPRLHHEIVKKCEDKDGKSNFILGSLTLFEGDIENASLYFKNAVDEIDNDEIRLKSRALYELSKCYIYMEKYSEAEETITQMTHLFDKEDNKDYLIVLNMWLSYDLMGMPDGVANALSLMKKTYEIASETDYEEIERVLQMLAKFYMYNDEVVKSIDLYIEALDIAEIKDNKEMIIRISSELATNCVQIGNNKEAIKYYNKAYQVIKNVNSLSQDMLTFGIFSTDGLFKCYLNENDLDKAWFYINESRDFINNQDSGKVKEDNLTSHYASLGEYYTAKDDISKALEYLNLAEERFTAEPYFNYSNFDVSLYTSFGDTYLAQKEYDKALEYYNKVEDIYASVLNRTPEKDCLEGFYNAYKGKGDYEKASYYAELMYKELNDSYISQEQQHATYMAEKYQNEQNEEKILKLQNKTES